MKLIIFYSILNSTIKNLSDKELTGTMADFYVKVGNTSQEASELGKEGSGQRVSYYRKALMIEFEQITGVIPIKLQRTL